MTRFYTVVIDGERATFFAHADEDQAAEQEHALMCEGYESRAIGDIDGDAYLIVYTRPKKAMNNPRWYRDTAKAEKSPQKATGTAQADPHRCRDCPECAVIFDTEGIHGHVPDRNSRTCQSCEHCKEAGQ